MFDIFYISHTLYRRERRYGGKKEHGPWKVYFGGNSW